MSISTDYPSPVTVNGYSCKNCTDVDNAKKHIDPAHPKDGPFGVNRTDSAAPPSPAVKFGGALTGLIASVDPAAQPAPTQGLRLDISA